MAGSVCYGRFCNSYNCRNINRERTSREFWVYSTNSNSSTGCNSISWSSFCILHLSVSLSRLIAVLFKVH
ncbi:hypothetical protein ZIOFF_026955 [Zingiber officinale]|uniref:Uncharacterized protein n=1 Tax=Zingiber officinale TaxID=94328 RepID=A0A8J5GY54_ZINOF|nr:hypothetical protein ZIOFF_026955 [Zingiber officinale]